MKTPDSFKQASDCDRLAELLPAFTVGALTVEEVRYVKSLLEQCPELQLDLAQYQAILSAFYERIEPVEPPKSLHRKLMNRLRDRIDEEMDMGEDGQKNPHELMATTQTDIED